MDLELRMSWFSVKGDQSSACQAGRDKIGRQPEISEGLEPLQLFDPLNDDKTTAERIAKEVWEDSGVMMRKRCCHTIMIRINNVK